MNPFEMVVLIVAIVMIASVLKSRRQRTSLDGEDVSQIEAARLRDEIQQLKQRIQTLERITVEKESSLEREIEDLRNRP